MDLIRKNMASTKKKQTLANPNKVKLGSLSSLVTVTAPAEITKPGQADPVKPVKPAKDGVGEKRERKAPAKKLAKDLSLGLVRNCVRFNGCTDKGKPIFLPKEVMDILQELSGRYHKAISARALASAVVKTVLSDFDGASAVASYMEQRGYVEPTDEELERRAKAAEVARQRRRDVK